MLFHQVKNIEPNQKNWNFKISKIRSTLIIFVFDK